METQDVLHFFRKINYNTEDGNDGKNYRYFHPLRVLKLARELIETEGIQDRVDNDCIFLLALFHDIGRNTELVKKHGLDPEKHDENNIALFEEYVYGYLDDPETKRRLADIVTDFSKKQYQLLESKAVRDADNLDEIGILNFWRMAVYAGKHKRDLQETIEFYFNVDRQDKIQKMEKELLLKASKTTAKKRLQEMDEIVEEFKAIALAEIEGTNV